ncbi:hypothetical protein ONZ43_g3388 [Nemania bipapillata]|uniref:Uncharacterized protein n=1 Tax=Nemania bipapillata TaxID=110536 RepID=A0ACC2IX43_9PEZI|nr:hypothetical protein ONZ43_g3388 [Nemania bipapillata]
MSNKPTNGRTGSFKSAARESLEAHLRSSGRARFSTSDLINFTPISVEEKPGVTNSETLLNKSPQYAYAGGESQQSEAKPSLDEPKPRRAAFSPNRPLEIPGAVSKVRPLLQYRDGFLALSGMVAPLTEDEVEELDRLDSIERAMDERFRRLKQGIFKWKAEKEGRNEDLFDPSSPSDQPTIPFNTPVSGSSGPESSGRDTLGKMVNFIFNAGGSMENLVENYSTRKPGDLQENTAVDNDSDSDEGDEILNYQRQALQPFAHQYLHTTADFAYKEGKKAGAYKEGYKAGLMRLRREKEYQLGYDAALRAYGGSPHPRADSTVVHKKVTRSPILRPDGTLILHDELAEEVRKMMDNLGVARADCEEGTEGGKKKGKESRRNSLEVSEFLKDLVYELSYTQ